MGRVHLNESAKCVMETRDRRMVSVFKICTASEAAPASPSDMRSFVVTVGVQPTAKPFQHPWQALVSVTRVLGSGFVRSRQLTTTFSPAGHLSQPDRERSGGLVAQ